MQRNWFFQCFQTAVLLLVLLCWLVSGSRAETLDPGTQLPSFALPAPDSEQTQKYLGLKTMEPFSLSAIKAKLVLVEFLSAT
jgi:hypothetical protein